MATSCMNTSDKSTHKYFEGVQNLSNMNNCHSFCSLVKKNMNIVLYSHSGFALTTFIIPKEIVIIANQNNKLPFSKIIKLGIQG